MWSCRLGKIKKSITNSTPIAEAQRNDSSLNLEQQQIQSEILRKTPNWQYLIEVIVASTIIVLLLSLAEAGSWSNINVGQFFKYMLYLNWIMLVPVCVMNSAHEIFEKHSAVVWGLIFLLILLISIITTTSMLNIINYWATHFSVRAITQLQLLHNLSLDLSYGMLLGVICSRYVYIRKKNLRHQTSALQAHIQSMQARIHPHFLFNSLNTVVCLISQDAEKAEQVLVNLTKLFRASLEQTKMVSLAYEIELCQYYLEIQQIRLGSRLQVEWNVQYDSDLTRVKIPLLTLQPLLENSILHGVEQHDSEAKVSILVELFSNQVTIVITNPVLHDRIKIRESLGFAMSNIKQRLIACLGTDAKLRHYVNNGMFITLIQYPITA
ncbi:two-component system sensor histidine kinase AlgZ [Acinetobacter calcoaceticus]|uniref:Two-component system sensor histidine kinase AlgZ n=1 Tax=Acinetobacter calcoaceticus TaxID=471 RepID=A0A4V2R255_ACICA|nr:two-component system sensor histidine kinase AlgZ [Acinetobacter calcoaceticus]